MAVLLKGLFAAFVAVIAALCIALQCLYWYGGRDLPRRLPGPSNTYSDAVRAVAWKLLGGKGEISVRTFNAVSYPALGLTYTFRYRLDPETELDEPADLRLLAVAAHRTRSVLAEQSSPLNTPASSDGAGADAVYLQQYSFGSQLEGIALYIRLSREWPATRMIDMILEHADYGRGATSLEQAARVYFGVTSSHLTATETVALLALDTSDRSSDPYCDPEGFRAHFSESLAKVRPLAANDDPMRQLTRLKPVACH